jgi:hypothetical protein
MVDEIKSGNYLNAPHADKKIMNIVGHMLKVSPDRRLAIEHLLELVEEDNPKKRLPPLLPKARRLPPALSMEYVKDAAVSQHSNSLKRSPLRWVDSHLKVGQQRKFGCLQSFVERDQNPPVQPDISTWAKLSDLAIASSSVG